MDFMTAVKTCFSKYTTFAGRAPRSEYWWFFLFNMIVSFVAAILDGVAGTNFTMNMNGMEVPVAYGWLYALWTLAIFLPTLSAFVRRLHDTNRSGWWFWLGLIPLIGAIVLLVFLVTPGTRGSNNYGADPLA